MTNSKPIKKPAVRKRKSAAANGAYFERLGPYKCVKTKEGQKLQGLHHALSRRLIGRDKWDYNAAKKSGRLTTDEVMPPAVPFAVVEPDPNCTKPTKSVGRLKGGIKLDTQLTRVVDLLHIHKLQLQVFLDRELRNRVLSLKFGTARNPHSTSIRNCVNALMPETVLAIRMFIQQRIHPVSTQDVVTWSNRVGTKVDLVVRHLDSNLLGVIEIKKGHAVNFGQRNLRLAAPFADVPFSTMSLCLLQTMAEGHMYASTTQKVTAPPLLLICNREQGARLFRVPAMFASRRLQLMNAL